MNSSSLLKQMIITSACRGDLTQCDAASFMPFERIYDEPELLKKA